MTHIERATEGAWHLDKKVPVALIMAIVIQTGTFIWWLSAQSARLETVVQVNATQDTRIGAIEVTTNAQAVNAATFAAQMAAVRESLQEIKEAQRENSDLLRRALQGDKP